MVRKLQSGLTYANVTATVALFIALGGGAYAAIDLVGRNDIKSRHIAPNQVKAADTSDRLRLECPGGTRYHEGACIETGVRSDATWLDAHFDCTDEERRLPSSTELLSFRFEPGITLGIEEAYEWTFHTDPNSDLVLVVREDTFGGYNKAVATPYRCVARPKR